MGYRPRLSPGAGQSHFLFGPRGTGKSTWLRHVYPDALYIDLLLDDAFRAYAARPERLVDTVKAGPRDGVVVIDEIQRVPALLPVVHHLIENRKGTRFVLTGSSARKLKRSGTDLLAGRALWRTMHPYMAVELGDDFDFARSLDLGMLPIVVESPEPKGVLAAYAGLYVREEVMVEGLVRRVGDFTRFLEAAALSHGSVLNVSNMARECEVQRKTVEAYLSVLEDLLLSVRLPVFTRRSRRALAAHPKFYLFDVGIYRSLRPSGPLVEQGDTDGPALEGLVLQHLRAWISYSRVSLDMHYWRTREGKEVDFVLYGNDGFYAIEVKRSTRIRPEDLRSLRRFRSEYPQCTPVLLYGGKERLITDNILCVPIEAFLKALHPAKELDDAFRPA